MKSALHEDLVAAKGDRLLDFPVNLFARQDVGIRICALAIERAEVANGGADVRVVNVAVYVVSAIRLGVQATANGVGGAAQRWQVAALKERHALFLAEAAAVNGFPQDVANGRCQGSPLDEPGPVRRPACSND